MPEFGSKSKAVRASLHPKLQLLVDRVVEIVDISLVESIRSEGIQTLYFQERKTKVNYPNSKHNATDDPLLHGVCFSVSDAIDLVPYPTAYKDKAQMLLVAGVVLAVAAMLGINIRWGGDWNGDGIINDNKGEFYDPWHFELVH